MWIVFAFRDVDYSYFKKPVFFLVTGAFVLCSMIELQIAERSDYSFAGKDAAPAATAYYRQMNQAIDALGFDAPKILNIFSHIHGYSISDRLYLNDPFVYRLLWENGTLDIKPMIDSIRERYFDVIMVPERIRPKENIGGPQGLIINEIVTNYVIGIKRAGYHFYIPL